MSRITKRGLAIAAAGAAAATIAVGATAAFAQPTHQAHRAGQTEDFIISTATHAQRATEGDQTYIVHGAFTGGGRDDASHNNYDVLHFGNGTVVLHHPEKTAKVSFHVNPKTCYSTFRISGPYTVTGTGHFKGLKGHGSYAGSGEYIAKRSSAGKCLENALPKAGIFTVHGSGPVTLP